MKRKILKNKVNAILGEPTPMEKQVIRDLRSYRTDRERARFVLNFADRISTHRLEAFKKQHESNNSVSK